MPKDRIHERKPWVDADLGLVGTVQSLTVAPHEARAQLRTRDNLTVFVTLYSDSPQPGLLSAREGMFRGALLAMAQRALSERQRISVDLDESSAVTSMALLANI